MSSTSSNILIIQTAFIGDAILVSSMIEALHKALPDSSLSLMVRQGNEGLYKEHPFLKEVLVLNKKETWWKRTLGMVSEVRKRRFRTVINVQRFFSTGLITALSGAKVRIGFQKNPLSFLFTHRITHSMKEGLHEVERNMALLKPIIGEVMTEPKLYPHVSDFEQCSRTRRYVCMAPSSVWFTKQWPKEKWVELISHVPEHLDILLIGAPSDQALCDEIKDHARTDRVLNMAGKFSLLESAALISKAEMSYVNDSAPMHLASAMNAPVSAIYCSTVPSFGFGPRSDISFVFQTEEALECRPCGLHGKAECPLGHFKCSQISPEQIAKESLAHLG